MQRPEPSSCLHSAANSSSFNFDYLPQGSPKIESDVITVRRAPGQRGPQPSACQRCRRLRSKCVFRKGGRLGEESCIACIKKGAECKIPQEIARRQPLPSRVEQAIVSTELSSAAVASLFDLYWDSTKAGIESNFVPILFHNSRSLQSQFDLVGRDIERLSASEQLRARLMWVASLKRWTFEGSDFDGRAASARMLEDAQKLADSMSIWRIPTLANFATLLLLFASTSNGNLRSQEARFYLSAAGAQFRQVFPDQITLVDPVSGKKGWAAYAFAVIDTAIALENASPPLLSDQDFDTFPTEFAAYPLPPPSLLLHLLPNSSAQAVERNTHPTIAYIRFGRRMAHYFARTERSTTNEQAFDTIHEAFQWLDLYEQWALGCLQVIASQKLAGVAKLSVESAITLNYVLCLMLALSIRDSLRRRCAILTSRTQEDPYQVLSHLRALVAAAETRCERLLCTYLRHTRNREGVYLLSASTGFLCSVDRLASIATTLSRASKDEYALFPIGAVDKLASVTFLLKSIRSAQIVYDSPILAQSVALLEESQATLQEECGYSGDMALILIVSYGATASDASGETCVPDVPSEDLVEAAVLMAGGAT